MTGEAKMERAKAPGSLRVVLCGGDVVLVSERHEAWGCWFLGFLMVFVVFSGVGFRPVWPARLLRRSFSLIHRACPQGKANPRRRAASSLEAWKTGCCGAKCFKASVYLLFWSFLIPFLGLWLDQWPYGNGKKWSLSLFNRPLRGLLRDVSKKVF